MEKYSEKRITRRSNYEPKRRATNYRTSVTAVSLSILTRGPDALLIIVTGHVPTTGARNVNITPHRYAHPPPDGIQEFSFGAEASDGNSFEQLIPVSTEYVMTEFISGFKGIRVTGSDGESVEALLDTANETPKSLQIVDYRA